jgi:cellobiose phosphorylase
LWTVQAFAQLGDAERAMELFDLINPVLHAATPEGVMRYQVEPYVAAADVYGVAPHTGRGGWTWYTGSAAWMYRVALESILGFELRRGRVRIRPCIPADWPEFEITFRYGAATYKFSYRNGANIRQPRVWFDGDRHTGDEILLVDEPLAHEILIDCSDGQPEPSPVAGGTARSAASRVG